jgi:hypothetical protein
MVSATTTAAFATIVMSIMKFRRQQAEAEAAGESLTRNLQ